MGATPGPVQLALDPAGRHLYTTIFAVGQNIYSFQIQADGSLGGSSNLACGNFCYQVWLHPTGRYLYTGGTAGFLMFYRNDATGQLSTSGVTGASFRILAGHPSGDFAYTVSTGNPAVIRTYRIDQSTGLTTLLGTANSPGNCTTACGGALIASYVF